MKNIDVIACVLLVLIFLGSCTPNKIPEFYVKSVSQPIVNLNGTWNINMAPENEFWKQNDINSNWKEIQVPGEPSMQGFSIKQDQPFVYKRRFEIPSDYQNKKILLKFDGVFSYARIWVNGFFVGEHHGGFTSWDCDITKFVEAGKEAWLTVEVTDEKEDLSNGSLYAKHPIGGILRDVSLTALPLCHFQEFIIETDLDENYRDANLIISFKTNKQENVYAKFKLIDPAGKSVPLSIDSCVKITDNKSATKLSIPIENPKKWDSEHPILYTLVAELYSANNELQYRVPHKIGFREIEIKKNKLLVNGESVKLRGACRHDIHPLLGRSASKEYDLKDVLLAKEANINFIRTSHYPPTKRFVEYCDQYGIYLEDETAVCFIGSFRKYSTPKHNEAAFENPYISQLKEMLNAHRNHPSVIIWSIGNESTYDKNFQKSYEYLKKADTTRPVIFSYPGTVVKGNKCFDLLSFHYPNLAGVTATGWGANKDHQYVEHDFESDTIPVLYDEWAHVACYNYTTLLNDPNVRDFWGKSLDEMWERSYNSEGALGGAIWGMVDEVFLLPENVSLDNSDQRVEIMPRENSLATGYGEWGIFDVWRRKKPEFWNTKKAYSPTKILLNKLPSPVEGKDLLIPIQNRFNHTNFNEIDIKWSYKNESGKIEGVDILPRQQGELTIPSAGWKFDDELILEFIMNDTFLIDKEIIPLTNKKEKHFPESEINEVSDWKLREDNRSVLLHSENLEVSFSKQTGLLDRLVNKNDTIISGEIAFNLETRGKYIGWMGYEMVSLFKTWKLKKFNHYFDKNKTLVAITEGIYDTIAITLKTEIYPSGKISWTYSMPAPPENIVRELGLIIMLGNGFCHIQWEKKGYWSFYPENSIGSTKGNTSIWGIENIYRQPPVSDWVHNKKSFYYWGNPPRALSNIARAAKTNIWEYMVLKSNKKSAITIVGTGNESCRLQMKDAQLKLFVSNIWDYPNLVLGNYMKEISVEKDNEYIVTMLLKN